MASLSPGDSLGELVGVAAPPSLDVTSRVGFSATRITFASDRPAQLPEDDAFMVCLLRRRIPPHPYWIGNRALPISGIEPGQFTFFDLRLQHRAQMRGDMDCVAMHISRDAIDRAADEHGVRRIHTLNIAPGQITSDPVVFGLTESLIPAFGAPDRAGKLFLDHVAMAMISHLGVAYGGMSAHRRNGGLTPAQERRAKEALLHHLGGDISLEDLARHCGLSRAHFARAFKTTTGLSPHRWLMRERLERAKQLLICSGDTLDTIAMDCGFADQAHFSRAFAKAMQTSPGRWRRQRQD